MKHKNQKMALQLLIVAIATLGLAGCGDDDDDGGGGGGADTTPNAFTFVAQTGVPVSSPITSAPVTITGIDAAADVTVTGGLYSVGCTATYVSTPGSVSNNQTICVRQTSAAANSAQTSTTLSVGGVTGTFTSTTEAVGAASAGVFSDDPVEGMSYVSGSISGTTDADGTFTYNAVGDNITFMVGDIEIGSGDAKPFMTPVDLVSDDDPSAVDETNDRVTNIARFLQTIDDDGDPSNGILITQAILDAAAGLSVEFNVTIAAFESDVNVQAVVDTLTAATTAGSRSLVSVAAAQSQLQATLLEAQAGNYAGTFDGTTASHTPVSGTWLFAVDASGGVLGTFTDDSGTVLPTTVPLTGTLASSGGFTLEVSASGYTLTLQGAVTDGVVDGVWDVQQAGLPVPIASGAFTGALVLLCFSNVVTDGVIVCG